MIFSLDIVENISSVLLVIVFSIIANEGFSRILFFISNLGLFDEKKEQSFKEIYDEDFHDNEYNNEIYDEDLPIRYL